MLYDYIRLAIRSLIKRRLRSWLTMIGIFIGIAAVVSLIGLGEGLRNAITSQFGNLGGDIISIQASGTRFGPPGSGAVSPLKAGLDDKIENINGVDFAISRLIESGRMKFNDRYSIAYLASMPDSPERKEVEDINGFRIETGRLLKDGDRNKIVLGNNFKKEDTFGKGISVGDKIEIDEKQFEVVGIVKKLGSFILDNIVMMNEYPLRELKDNTEKVSIIAVKVKEEQNIQIVKERIEKLLRKERDVKEGEEDFTVELAANTIETINSTLFAVQLFVYIIASISLLVGGIGIMNTMYTAVVERTREIGIMKSIGARNSNIFVLFLVESGLLGMIGGLIGMVLGIVLAKGLAAIGAAQLGSDLIQAEISFGLIFGALSFSFIIGCIAGITPAIRASKLHPVDALRHVK